MPPVQKSALNLGHVYAPRAKVCPESVARFCPRGMEKMKLGLPFWGALYFLFFF